MNWIKAVLLTGILSNLFLSGVPAAFAAEGRRGDACRRGDRLHIEDLDMSPDPVVEGQRIRIWKVRLRFDGQRECETDIVIREGSNVTGNMRNYRLRPGVNAIEIPANDGFRLRGREHCFNVQVDLDGSRQPVDADRRFCASQRTMWSMRESDDRRRSDR
ncbi:MAG TPA: hypothetical protein VMS25_12130 [Candidatus Limnocylindrales bacterium]|nr:hypothetical protein [Candidatus Limnocylindrales bacterium]